MSPITTTNIKFIDDFSLNSEQLDSEFQINDFSHKKCKVTKRCIIVTTYNKINDNSTILKKKHKLIDIEK